MIPQLFCLNLYHAREMKRLGTDLSADDINDHLFEIFKFIFLEAEDVTFEDGIESSFSRKVQTIVRIYWQ